MEGKPIQSCSRLTASSCRFATSARMSARSSAKAGEERRARARRVRMIMVRILQSAHHRALARRGKAHRHVEGGGPAAAVDQSAGTAAALHRAPLDYLEKEVWPTIPRKLRGRRLTKNERERILGYGQRGF